MLQSCWGKYWETHLIFWQICFKFWRRIFLSYFDKYFSYFQKYASGFDKYDFRSKEGDAANAAILLEKTGMLTKYDSYFHKYVSYFHKYVSYFHKYVSYFHKYVSRSKKAMWRMHQKLKCCWKKTGILTKIVNFVVASIPMYLCLGLSVKLHKEISFPERWTRNIFPMCWFRVIIWKLLFQLGDQFTIWTKHFLKWFTVISHHSHAVIWVQVELCWIEAFWM